MRFAPPGDGERTLVIAQGVEMGRPSRIALSLEVEGGALQRGVDRRLGGAGRRGNDRSVSAPRILSSRRARPRLRAARRGRSPRPRRSASPRIGARALASQPRLYNGRVLLLGRHAIETRADGERRCSGEYFETDFAAFLAWRDFGFPDPTVVNAFSMAALVGADGAFLLGEMAAHTANAGATYFPAGTPDPSDVFDGKRRSRRQRAARTQRGDGDRRRRGRLRPGLDRRLRPAAHRLPEGHAARRAGRGGQGARRSVSRRRPERRARVHARRARAGRPRPRPRARLHRRFSSTSPSLTNRRDSRDACARRRSSRAPALRGRRRIARRLRRFPSRSDCRPTC